MVLAVLEQSFEQLLNLDWGSDLNDEHLIFGWLFWTIGLFFKSSFPFSFVATSSVYRPVFSKLCNFHKKINIFLASSVDPPQINAGTVLWKITCIISSRIGLFSIFSVFHLLFSIFHWIVGDGYSHRIWIAQWWTWE